MDKSIKEDWLEALRSGEHVQGRKYLERRDGSQCCLGVLCDIMDLDFEVIKTRNSYLHRVYCYNGAKSGAFPPEEFLDEVGISQAQAEGIALLNDNGNSFEEIADWIEVNL